MSEWTYCGVCLNPISSVLIHCERCGGHWFPSAYYPYCTNCANDIRAGDGGIREYPYCTNCANDIRAGDGEIRE